MGYLARRAKLYETKVDMLEIRERELNLCVTNQRNLGFTAVVIGGFAYFALVYTDQAWFKVSSEQSKFFYCMGITICQGLACHVGFCTIAINMLGYSLALRGPTGSMDDAVDGMFSMYEHMLHLFNWTIVSFVAATTVSFAWTSASTSLYASIIVTLICFFTVFVIIVRTQTIEETF